MVGVGPGRDAGAEEEAGVFGCKRQAEGGAGGKPPGAVAGGDETGEGKEGDGPEEEDGGVGRHRHGTDAEQEGAVEQDGGDQAGVAPGQQVIAGTDQQDGAECGAERGEEADAERGVTGERGAEMDPQGNHGGVIEIAGGKGAGPDPVIGFVRRERHEGGDGEASPGEAEQPEPGAGQEGRHGPAHAARRPAPVRTARRRGCGWCEWFGGSALWRRWARRSGGW